MRAYLDWNATTPPRPEVLDAMAGAARVAWGNPSSVHAEGRAAHQGPEVDGSTRLLGDPSWAVGALVPALVVETDGVDLVARAQPAGPGQVPR